jgi:PAS domain S-box-containing protein
MARRPSRTVIPTPAQMLEAPAGGSWASLYDTAPVGLCVLDLASRHLFVNRRFTELVKRPAADFLGRTVEEVNPGSGRATKKLLRQIASTGQPIRDLEFSSHRDPLTGEQRSWLAHWAPIKDPRGRVVAVNIAFEECTGLLRAEAERDRLLETLHGERQRLTAILEQMPAGVIIVEAPSGRSLFGNRQSARIFRHPFRPAGQIADYGSWRLFHLDGRVLPPERYPLARAVLHGETVTGEEVLIERGDGTRGFISANAAPIRDSRRRIVAAVVTFFDISARRELDRALIESEGNFRRIAENSPFGINAYKEQGDIAFMNAKLTEIIGYRAEDVPRREDWYRRIYPDPRYRKKVIATWTADIARVRRGEVRHCPVRIYRLTCRDGTVKDCEITFAHGQDARYSIFNDVTERLRAEAAIRALNANLEQRVAERTAQLDAANGELRHEIAERQRLQTQLLDVSEREQRRLGESLHDMLGQHLTGLGLLSSAIERELRQDGHRAADRLAHIGAMLQQAVQTARDLSRQFYPVALEQGGLLLALKDLAATTQAISGVPCSVQHRSTFRIPAAADIHLYRIAQEAVTNALKHAAPRAIRIELTQQRRRPLLRIVNDGRPWRPPRAAGAGLGLHIMQHRAALIGAQLTLARGLAGGCILECAFLRA